jgi:hypothetical protein
MFSSSVSCGGFIVYMPMNMLFLNNRYGSVEIQRVMPDVSTGTLLSDALQLLTSAAS